MFLPVQKLHVFSHCPFIISIVFSWVQKSTSSLQFLALSSHFLEPEAVSSAGAWVTVGTPSWSGHSPQDSGQRSRYLQYFIVKSILQRWKSVNARLFDNFFKCPLFPWFFFDFFGMRLVYRHLVYRGLERKMIKWKKTSLR